MSSQTVEPSSRRQSKAFLLDYVPVQETIEASNMVSAESLTSDTKGGLINGIAKEKRLADFVTNAEATRKTAGAEGFKRSQNMKIECVVTGLLTDGQQVGAISSYYLD
jgi:hypothetical protein